MCGISVKQAYIDGTITTVSRSKPDLISNDNRRDNSHSYYISKYK